MSKWKRLAPKRLIEHNQEDWVQFEEVTNEETSPRQPSRHPRAVLVVVAATAACVYGALQLPAVQFQIGTMFYEGRFLTKDRPAAVRWLKSAAERGHTDAQFYVGYIHDVGDGAPQNFREAFVWYTRAARRGHQDAQFNLGFMYDNGLGVAEDDQQALLWYRRVAAKGDPAAMNKLAETYAHGKGIPHNWSEARKWYAQAAELGLPEAQIALGRMYAEGHGVTQDDAQAEAWLKQAAEQGDADGQVALGEWYMRQAHFQQAIAMFEKAANQGHAGALAHLGGMFRQGKGVLASDLAAYKWYHLAALKGHAGAGRAKAQLRRSLNEDAAAVAEAQAEAWLRRRQ